nr:hypothetical protein [Tanacetum cinerariifolium]
MATTIEQQVALNEALVPSTKRLRIGRSSFRLPSDIQSKESPLQVVYDVLRRCPFFKAFLVTADVPKIYMQEFWATAYIHQYSIRFKMDSKKNIVDLETFRDMLHICLRVPGQSFDELPFEEEILDFLSMLNPTSDAGMESIFATASSSTAPLQTSKPIMTPSSIAIITTISHVPIPPTTIPSEVLQNLSTFDSVFRFEDRLKSLEVNFSEFIQTNQFAEVVSNILDRLRNSYQRENDEFLRIIDDDMKRIIKEQVKSQVKEQVSWIIPRIKESVNAQLEAEVLTRSFHSSRTSYVVAADLSEMELKKILIEKMEGNKSIQRSDEQRNLYKALVDAYEADKIILDSYGETAILKRRREDDDDQEGPFAGSDRGSKRRREGGELESARAPLEPATRSAGKSTTGSKSRQASTTESAFAEEPVQTISQIEEPSRPVFEKGAEDQPIIQTSQHPEWFPLPKKPLTPDHDWNQTMPAVQGSAQTWISELAKQADSRSFFNELLDTLLDFSNFIINRLGVDTLNLELLTGPTYELMRGSCNSLTELEYHLEEVYKATTDQLDWVNPKGQQYPHNLLQPLSLIPDNQGRREPINYDKHALWGVSHWGWKRQQFYGFTVNRESALDVYSKRRIIAVTDLKIVEWHNYNLRLE